MPYYLNISNVGVRKIDANGDGSTLTIHWHRAFPKNGSNKIAYNIYLNTELPVFESDFFLKTPSFVSIDGVLKAEISGLTPGQMYRCGVRAVEYNASTFNLANLPQSSFGTLRVYPESILREDITENSAIIPLLSVDDFPSTGVVKIGVELIQYSSVDATNDNLVLTNTVLQRGYNGTKASIHTVDGYDGYATWDPTVLFFTIDNEEQNTVVYATQDRFDFNQYSFNLTDGYRQATQDIVNTDLSVSDAVNEGFPAYDYAGYHRIDPVALLNGDCVGSYFGGQMGCADGYYGVNGLVRGISVDDRNTQRQEIALSIFGESVCLVKRQWLGIYCKCVIATSEHPSDNCDRCFGTGKVLGYQQYFDNRNADGKIKVKFDPWVETLPLTESGLNVQDVKPGAWTLVLPAIKPRDFIVRFDQDGNEEFRYEVINVGRNVLFNQQFGAQKLSLQRIRKTDQIYKFPVFPNLGSVPMILGTNIASSLGIPPHSHQIRTNETHPSNWNQVTSIAAGHSHRVIYSQLTGEIHISEELGHSHSIMF